MNILLDNEEINEIRQVTEDTAEVLQQIGESSEEYRAFLNDAAARATVYLFSCISSNFSTIDPTVSKIADHAVKHIKDIISKTELH